MAVACICVWVFSLMSLCFFPLFVVAFPCFLNGHDRRTKCISKKRKISYVPLFLLLMMMLLLFRTKYYHDCFALREALNDSIHLFCQSVFRHPRTA